MKEKSVVIAFLEKAGFKESGHNQFIHEDFGRIHVKEYEAYEVAMKLKWIGEQHRAKQIREALIVKEDWVFDPNA